MPRSRVLVYLAILVLIAILVPPASSAQTQTPGPASQRAELDPLLLEVAQQAVNRMNCRDTTGTPRVLEIRRESAPSTDAGPVTSTGSAQQFAVVVGGEFNLSGLFPGFSG
jgi:hypothetical protein